MNEVDPVSINTKHTTRNFLIAGSATLFSLWLDLKLHELALFWGTIDSGRCQSDCLLSAGGNPVVLARCPHAELDRGLVRVSKLEDRHLCKGSK